MPLDIKQFIGHVNSDFAFGIHCFCILLLRLKLTQFKVIIVLSSSVQTLFFQTILRQIRPLGSISRLGGGGLWRKSLVPRHFTVSHAFQPADTL